MKYNTKCNHIWKEDGNRIVCELCGQYKLKKIKINDDLSYGVKSDGKKYTIRKNRLRYFYPNEWLKFYNSLTPKHALLFDFLIKTGARIDEALHFKLTDLIDDKRKTIRLTVTKKKSKVVGEEEEGSVRIFEIDAVLYNKLKRETPLYVFLNINHELPLKESKRIAANRAVSTRALMKRKLKKIRIEDWYNFALHNIRKTHGMWLKAHHISMEEICLRLGHDINTYLKHYGSPSLFDRKDLIQMVKILGSIYGL